MEFLTTKQKRDKSRRLFLGYGLFGILILLATYIMVSTALGYEVFRTKGEVVQNGLLFIDSRPDAAIITINGNRESQNTNAKLSLPEGRYDIVLQKDGFRDWARSINLSGGSVKFLTYPRLLPVSLEGLSSTSYIGKEMQSQQSRDKRWLVMHSVAEPSIFRIHDLDRPTADILTLSLPQTAGELIAATSVTIVEWAGDNVHFLVRVDSPGATKLFVLNRDKPGEVNDATTIFGFSGTLKATFWDGKWDELAVVDSSGIIRLASIKDKSVSAVPLIAEQVLDFYPLSEKRAIYTTSAGDSGISVRVLEGGKTYQIISLPKSDEKLLVKGGGFNRNDFLILSGGGLEKALLYRNLVDSIKQSTTGRVTPFVTMPIDGEAIDFSRSNRFAFVASDAESAVYDIEQKELFRYQTPVTNSVQIGWFDDVRLYARTVEGTLYVYDYNGENMYELAKNTSSMPFVNQAVEHAGVLTATDSAQTLQVINIFSKTE